MEDIVENVLEHTVNSFNLQGNFATRRNRELPIRNYVQLLLKEKNIICQREARVRIGNRSENYRSIDLVVDNNNYFQFGHYTLAQYGGVNARPIAEKLLAEQNVFNEVNENLKGNANKYLVYITTDIIDCPEITDEHVKDFPLLRYFQRAHYNNRVRDGKLGIRHAELLELKKRNDIKFIGSYETKNFILIGGIFRAKLYIDFINLI